MKKKIIIDRWEFSAQEAMLFAFIITKDIDIQEWVISTKWFWSCIVKQNKESIKLQLFRPLTEDKTKDYITRLLELIINSFYDVFTKPEYNWYCNVYWVDHECGYVNPEWGTINYCPKCWKLTKYN